MSLIRQTGRHGGSTVSTSVSYGGGRVGSLIRDGGISVIPLDSSGLEPVLDWSVLREWRTLALFYFI